VGCGEVGSASRKAGGADAGGVDGERDSEKVDYRWLRTPEEVMALGGAGGPNAVEDVGTETRRSSG